MLRKQLAIIKTAWVRGLTYRFSVAVFRLSDTVELLAQIVIWYAVYGSVSVMAGYTYDEMVTYVVVGYLMHVMSRNFLSQVVSEDIEKGTLSQYLVKPIKYLSYIMTKEVGRIGLVFFFSVATQILVALFFTRHLVPPRSLSVLAVMLLMLIFAFAINLFLSFLVGCVAFWTTETQGPQIFLNTLRRMLAGNFFPLSLLPASLITASFLMPFSYSFFVPMQLYLGKMGIQQGFIGIGVEVAWLIILYGITRFVWSRGMRAYESVGI